MGDITVTRTFPPLYVPVTCFGSYGAASDAARALHDAGIAVRIAAEAGARSVVLLIEEPSYPAAVAVLRASGVRVADRL